MCATDAEVARGKIPQGESLPLHLIPLRIHEWTRRATTVFYCQMGGRSAQAAAFAAASGFADVYNLQGGIIGWGQAGLPTHDERSIRRRTGCAATGLPACPYCARRNRWLA